MRVNPRMRGEDAIAPTLKLIVKGESPHARGRHITNLGTGAAMG